jgi:pilus assembly protein Flp/PilA
VAAKAARRINGAAAREPANAFARVVCLTAFTHSPLIPVSIYLPPCSCYTAAHQVDLRGAIDMLKQIKKFLKNESGAAAVEYGLITSGISVAIIPSVTGVGNKLATIFTQVQNAL